MTKEELINLLNKDINDTKIKIDSNSKLSIKRLAINCLIKCGIGIKYAFPYLFCVFFLSTINKMLTNKTLFKDDIKRYAYNKYTITSTGLEDNIKSYDIKYDENYLKYSTKWSIDNNFYYKRVETIYDYDISNEFNNEEFFNFINKDFLDDNFSKKDIVTIKKKELDINDYMYKEDMFIATYSEVDKNDYIVHKETTGENIVNNLWIYVGALFLSCNPLKFYNFSYGKKVIRKLNELDSEYKYLNNDEVNELEKVLKLKQKNLELITKGDNHYE